MAFFGNLACYIQSYEMFITRSVKGVSIPAFILSCINSLSWVVYGIIKRDLPIIVGNLIGLGGALLVTFLIYYFR